MLRAIKRQGTNNYWDLKLPQQTEEYVPQFMAVVEILRDPKKYDFDDVVRDDPMEFDRVALKGAVDLRALAQLADCSYEELKTLNPAVLRHAATGANGVTVIRVPTGKGEKLLAKLRDGESLPAVDLTVQHKVRRGETLQRIANQYHVSAQRLALANGIGRRRPLRRGMLLTVPASLSRPAPVLFDMGDPRAASNYVPPRDRSPRRLVQGQSDGAGRAVHTVRKGQTLASIAKSYGVSVSDMKRWNGLKTERVRRGMRLKVRTGAAAQAKNEAKPASPESQVAANEPATDGEDSKLQDAAPAPDKARSKSGSRAAKAPRASAKKADRPHHVTIVVHRGETLATIASRHGVSVKKLMRTNGLATSRVRAGQRLKLPTS